MVADEAQRLDQKMEQSADRIAATLRGTLAETGERLGNSLIPPPEDGLLLTIEENRLVAAPPESRPDSHPRDPRTNTEIAATQREPGKQQSSPQPKPQRHGGALPE